jgi:DNA-binding CsgD family transcriptional regulator
MTQAAPDLAETIEAAALDVSLWPTLLLRLAEEVDAQGAALVYQNQVDGSGASIIVGIDPAATPLYFGEFANKNPIQRANSVREKIENFQPRIRNDEELLPKSELTRSDFYNGVLRPHGMHSIMMIGLGIRETHRVGINLVRDHRRPQFESATLSDAARWHAPLIRAFDVGIAISSANQINAGLVATLDTLADAMLVVDGEARVMFCNRRASEVAAAGVVRIAGGRLRVPQPDQDRRLEFIIARAALGRPPVGAAIPLRAADARRSLLLTVTPLSPERATLFDCPRSVMVRIAELGAARPVKGSLLTELFGLTPAESRVASVLAEGQTLRDAADQLGVSVNTVRTHLARIFDKVGVNRQAELVRLMIKLGDTAG